MGPYFRAAALESDPVQRMKLIMSASISFLEPCHTWAKPLNPILGETIQATPSDGSVLSVEQVCHHPPCSYLLLEGPNNSYRYYSYSTFSVKAHINSISLEVSGRKIIEFPDGSSIVFNNQEDTFGNTLIGSLNHVLHGKIKFEDKVNGITGVMNMGFLRRVAKDYFEGYIESKGERLV